MDVVDVRDVEESVARFGDRYLRRVYTTRELAACAGGADSRRLAACFAAKEATLKTLSVDDEPLDWRSIDVALAPSGEASVELRGRCADRAAQTGIVQLSVSVGSTRSHAAAVVLAEGTSAVVRTT
jgi:holo-[acyl-carrier protein] synthase